MGHSNQEHASQSLAWMTNHSLTASALVYLLICVPVYLWLEGPVGGAGTIDGSIVLFGLATGTLLFVPIIKAMVIQRFMLSPTEQFTAEEPSS